MKNPLVGEPVNFGEFFHGPASGHMLGLMGGVIWGTGTVFNLVAANFTGVAISYAIGQSAPMVAALWEFSPGKNSRAPIVRQRRFSASCSCSMFSRFF
jgi:glucose uptake protein